MGLLSSPVGLILFWSLVFFYGIVSCFYFLGLLAARRIFHKVKEKANFDGQPQILADSSYGRHRYIKLQGVKLHYMEDGNPDNPLLILIHGCPGFWFCWRKQIPILANYFWVISLDLRGCGDSEAPKRRSAYRTMVIVQDIVQLIRRLDRSSAHVICNETAGNIGWQLAASYPRLVEKMIFINAPHPYVIRQLFQNNVYYYIKYWYMLFLQVPFLPEMFILEKSDAILNLGIGSHLNKNIVSEEELEAYKYTFSRKEDWYGVIHHLRQINLCPIVEPTQPGALPCSTLLLMGSSHPYLSKETAYRSAEFVERIKIKVVEGGKNSLQVTHAKKVNEEILNFLDPPPTPSQNSSANMSNTHRHSLVDRVFGAVKSPYTMLTKTESNNYVLL